MNDIESPPIIVYIADHAKPGQVIEDWFIEPCPFHTQPVGILEGTEFFDHTGGSGPVVELWVKNQSNYEILLDSPGWSDVPGDLFRLSRGQFHALAYEAYLGPVPMSEALREVAGALMVDEPLDEDHADALRDRLNVGRWTQNHLRITSRILSEGEIRQAKVLGGPRERGGIVPLELHGVQLWGDLTGEAASRHGLQLSSRVYPTYEDACRARMAAELGPGADTATAEQIDAMVAGETLRRDGDRRC